MPRIIIGREKVKAIAGEVLKKEYGEIIHRIEFPPPSTFYYWLNQFLSEHEIRKMNTLEVKNAIAKPITESMYVGEKDRTTILANVESYLIENRILFPAPEEVNRLVGEVLSKIREEKKEKARKNELDQLLWDVLWKPLGRPRDIRKSFKLNNPQIELLLVSSPSWDSDQWANIWSTMILHGMK